MRNEIRALDFISMLLNDPQHTSQTIKISFTAINNFRNNLFLEDFYFDLGLYDFEDIAHNYPRNIQIASKEIVITIDDDFENRILRNVSKDSGSTKILELWKK